MKILSYRFPELQSIVAKFNKKATKWGLPLVTLTLDATYVEERNTITVMDGEEVEQKVFVEVNEVTIIGDIPKKAGWSVHSKIQTSETPGHNYVFTAPNKAFDDSLSTRPMFCNHCNTKRLKKLAYIIENDDGQSMMVGATCLVDFLPNIDADQLLAYLNGFEAIANQDFDEELIPRGQYLYPTDSAISDAYVSINKCGFVSRAKAELDDTLFPTSLDIDPDPKSRVTMYEGVNLEEAKAKVDQFKTWVNEHEVDGGFIQNLKLAIMSEYIPSKLFGYIAAGVNSWIKSISEAIEKTAVSNEHVGTEGQRTTFHNLKVVNIIVIEGNYGNTYLNKFINDQGNSFTWFASNNLVNVGDTVNLIGTIKKHDEFKGRKTTVITRCKII